MIIVEQQVQKVIIPVNIQVILVAHGSNATDAYNLVTGGCNFVVISNFATDGCNIGGVADCAGLSGNVASGACKIPNCG
ncbi:MAG: hypothetical protein V1799_14630 [bacterium]